MNQFEASNRDSILPYFSVCNLILQGDSQGWRFYQHSGTVRRLKMTLFNGFRTVHATGNHKNSSSIPLSDLCSTLAVKQWDQLIEVFVPQIRLIKEAVINYVLPINKSAFFFFQTYISCSASDKKNATCFINSQRAIV